MLRGLIDTGVPVLHRAQVKTEVFINLQLPALFTQARHLIEGEVEPGTVIDHFKQFAGAFRQRLALAGGNFKAQCAQLLAKGVFRLGLAFDPQGLVFLADQDVGVFLPAGVLLKVIERQRGTVLDIALHFAVARFEGAEFGTGQP